MKFIDLTTITDLPREKVAVGASALAITTLCVVVFVGMYTMLDNKARADLVERELEASIMAAEASEAAATATTTTEITETTTEQTELAPVVQSSEVTETIEATEATETAVSEETAETTLAETTAEVTTTRDPNYVEEYYATVYCSHDINLRTGPGTGYDVVRVLHVGDEVTVTGRTDSGWYRTYSGNYVLQAYTSTEPVATTSAATTQTTAASTTAATTAATQPAQSSGAGSIDGMTYYGQCRITFYGPQPLSDGSYSTTTATGTTCSEGRTVAADWSIFPAGTTLYLPNDPLGGDGYYTVEDRGPGVNGSHLDLFANSASSHVVTTCDVYVVN